MISRVGPDATDLKVGDRVIFFSRGAFASHMTCPESNCAKMPDDMTFEQGATMPTVYSTSIYSLLELGGLKKGQVSPTSLTSSCSGLTKISRSSYIQELVV